MWLALLFVMYTDGVPYAEVAVVNSYKECLQLRQEFNQVVKEDRDIIQYAKSNCIRV